MVIHAHHRGYRVSDDGKIINPKGVQINGTRADASNNYQTFGFRIEGKRVICHTHKLQAYQQYGLDAFAKGIQVRHLDGNRYNNSKENIKIGTPHENYMDRSAEERRAHALVATSYLIKYNAQEVKAYYALCKSYKKTMSNFGISSKGTLSHILNKR
jgi:hypothetical protein